MESNLGKRLSLGKLFVNAIPAIMMMIAISVYSVVDGFFVSNFAGKTQFAAVNLIYPFIMVIGSVGFMMGAGGAALVAKRFGEGRMEEANKCFFNCVAFTIVIGVLSSIGAYFALPYVARWLGSSEEMLPHCVTYGRILVIGITFFNLQNLFQSFFQAAEKSTMGFLVTIAAGVTNIALDAILIAGPARLGVVGAGIGTIAGQAVGAVVPLIYFIAKNKSPLRLRFHPIDMPSTGKMVANGSSEFITNISASAVSIVINIELMRFYGESGVGAYGIIAYVWLIFAACFIGFNVATGPRISYAYGAKDCEGLRVLYRHCMLLLLIMGVAQCGLSLALSKPIALAFAGYDQDLCDLTFKASLIYSLVYLFLGYNMFGSAFFTALNNGIVSLALSALRLGVIEILAVVFFANVVGGEGVWWSIPFAEGLGIVLNIGVMAALGKRYGYRGERPKPLP